MTSDLYVNIYTKTILSKKNVYKDNKNKKVWKIKRYSLCCYSVV